MMRSVGRLVRARAVAVGPVKVCRRDVGTIQEALQIAGRERRRQEKDSFHCDTTVCGWVRSLRKQKRIAFASLTDGSTTKPLQVVLSPSEAEPINVGEAVEVKGRIQESKGKGQDMELQAEAVTTLGQCDTAAYPIQAKDASPEFLRTVPHLRMRTSTLGAALRVRSHLTQLTHSVFAELNFLNVHTPILTSNDCEGAGEAFKVSSPAHDETAAEDSDTPSSSQDPPSEEHGGLFRHPMHLTVSGQLHAEAIACGAHPRVYTLGPVFRAENSHTPRHLSEFYMLEAEMACADLNSVLDLQQTYISHLLSRLQAVAGDELDFLWSKNDKARALVESLSVKPDHQPFHRITYTEAIQVLEKQHAKKKFTFVPAWGRDLAFEHEQFVAELCGGPVFITQYPKCIKPFYMLESDKHPEQGPTVDAADLIVPGAGELTGGSAREHRYDILLRNIREQLGHEGVRDLEWYLDLRRFGSVPHAGFGLGFERLMLAVTGLKNVRDVIPFPRHPGVCYL